MTHLPAHGGFAQSKRFDSNHNWRPQAGLATVNNAYLSAGVVLAMVPCVVLYLALQRYYVQGMMSGALKG